MTAPGESTASLAAISVALLADFSTSFVTGPSSGSFTMLNTVQLLLLLPLIPKYMPQRIIEFMFGMSMCLGTFSFIKFASIFFISDALNWFSVSQSNSYLDVIGLNSQSSFVNTYSMLGFMLVIPFIHMFIWILK